MGHCLYLKKGNIHTVPVSGLKLGNIAEGTLVKIPEKGKAVEYYVTKHNYQSDLNGMGRTLLVRKTIWAVNRQWNSAGNNAYANSTIDATLSGTFFTSFPEEIQLMARGTKFWYTVGNTSSEVKILERGAFLLSAKELGLYEANSNINPEGEELPIASRYRHSYGWTRTPDLEGTGFVAYVDYSGYLQWLLAKDRENVIPCFTLPATTVFDKNTLEIKI